MIFFQQFAIDREQDILVDLYMEGDRLFHVIRTPNHHSGNLISNLARLCGLETEVGEHGLLVIRGEVPSYVDGSNRKMYIFRLGNTKIANIFPDGRVELKASVPAISKTLMSQTKDYRLGIEKTIVKTYIRSECKFRTDLHTHMNGNLPPDVLIALGIHHQIRYPLYYIRKLNLRCTPAQEALLAERRSRTEQRLLAEGQLDDPALTEKKRNRKINDQTFLNFADLILGNPAAAEGNISAIRNSLTIPKDGQAVFANLEKVYLYRYVFTRGIPDDLPFSGLNPENVPNREIRAFVRQMRQDRESGPYVSNTLFQDLLLWIARMYRRQGIEYAEISDTLLLNPAEVPARLRQIHEVMPAVTRETGVLLRFLAGIRRVPLTIVRDHITPEDYLADNLRTLRAVAADPYIAGSDIIGEEVNDILELRPAIRELVRIAAGHPGFVIRIHAGENDSLRDNVANSIRCVTEALAPGQPMPDLRVGHGLYTCDLRSERGRKLLEDMQARRVTLEFQITSNVRLNNLSRLEGHPLRHYLKAGVRCVQGTDGGALYGTNSIDEELSLEKLLGLTFPELCQMAQADREWLDRSLQVFRQKSAAYAELDPRLNPEVFFARRLAQEQAPRETLWKGGGKRSPEIDLAEKVRPLPEGVLPVVLAGGSFNNSSHKTRLREEDRRLLDTLLDEADPRKVCFVVGHTLSGQEGYLVRRNQGRFRVFAMVPNELTPAGAARLRAADVFLRVSIEPTGMGLYKSFAYEIFNRMPSVLLAFDGNAAALNLIQEARNGRQKCAIFLNPRSRGLADKAHVLEGYVRPLTDPADILAILPEDKKEPSLP